MLAVRLQWGRDEGAAEKSKVAKDSPVAAGLQWGRDEGAAEKAGVVGQAAARAAASMGPRRGCRGKGRRRVRPGAVERPASMGPRRGCRGKGWSGTPTASSTCGFNGAATRVPRKSLDRLLSGHGGVFASMGPRRGCRGKGATSMTWNSRVEQASMGPRRGCRGKVLDAFNELDGENELQWGRDEGAAEKFRALHVGVRPGHRGFNGAATRVPRKRPRGAPDLSSTSKSFNGAATRVPRKRAGTSVLCKITTCVVSRER